MQNKTPGENAETAENRCHICCRTVAEELGSTLYTKVVSSLVNKNLHPTIASQCTNGTSTQWFSFGALESPEPAIDTGTSNRLLINALSSSHQHANFDLSNDLTVDHSQQLKSTNSFSKASLQCGNSSQCHNLCSLLTGESQLQTANISTLFTPELGHLTCETDQHHHNNSNSSSSSNHIGCMVSNFEGTHQSHCELFDCCATERCETQLTEDQLVAMSGVASHCTYLLLPAVLLATWAISSTVYLYLSVAVLSPRSTCCYLNVISSFWALFAVTLILAFIAYLFLFAHLPSFVSFIMRCSLTQSLLSLFSHHITISATQSQWNSNISTPWSTGNSPNMTEVTAKAEMEAKKKTTFCRKRTSVRTATKWPMFFTMTLCLLAAISMGSSK